LIAPTIVPSLMQNTIGYFLYQSIYSKMNYKQEIYSDELPLIQSQNFLQVQNELEYNKYDYIKKLKIKI
jgi:hypothetical protein